MASNNSISLGWEPFNEVLVPNSLDKLLNEAKNNSFSFLNVPIQVEEKDTIVLDLSDFESLKSWQMTLLASSDRSLENSNDWSNRILFKINLNDPNLMNLLDYAAHLTVFAVSIEVDWELDDALKLLALNQKKNFPFKIHFECYYGKWKKWSSLLLIHERTNQQKQNLILNSFGVIPIISQFDENIQILQDVWKIENIKGLLIDESVFIRNAKGYPVLSRVLQNQIKEIHVQNDCPIILRTGINLMSDCSCYIRWLLNPEKRETIILNESEQRLKEFVSGFENVLQTPLQPLHDHLPSETYEVFERDPVKYQLYEEAIEAAIRDLIVLNHENLRIGVFGAGRGPLVQAVLNASEKIGIVTKVTALEKSPNACLTLLDRFRGHSKVEIVFGDMRKVSHKLSKGTFHIIVSELLGSFGDNELSPECLWPVEEFLSSEGILIPQKYTSYIEPCYAPFLREQVKELQGVLTGNSFDYGYIVHVTESKVFRPFKDPLPVFSFKHPKSDECTNQVAIKLGFNEVLDSSLGEFVIDGLIGYFDCQLYGHVRMSTVPSKASSNMLSWFPIYFPLKNQINKQGKSENKSVSVEFYRKRDGHRIWYEWGESGKELQNVDGASFTMFL